jgi:multiple sugar transport system substrate-binding protein
MVRKRIFVLLMFVLLVITGCKNQPIIDNRDPSLNFETNQKAEVVMWHTYSEAETKVFENTVIPLFEEEYPTIDIKPVRQAYNEQLKSALIARASANKQPDVIRMDIAWLPTFANLGLLYPVSDFDDFDEVKESLYSEPLHSNFYEGEYYGLPLNTVTKVAIYNKSLLAEAGYNKPPETMAEVVNIIENHPFVLGMSGLSAWQSLPYFYGFGGKLTDPTNSKAIGYLDSKESIEAVNKLLDLYHQSKLTPKLLSGNSTETWEGIQVGDYFMIDEGPWFYSVHSEEYIKYIQKQTVSAPFPVTNEVGSILGGENLVLSKGAKHPEEAWTFMKWMTTEKPQKMMLQTGLIPSNKYVDFSDFLKKYPYYQSYIESLDQSFLRPQLAQWGRIEEVYVKYLKLIFSGSVSVETGLKEAAKEIEKLLVEKKGR